MHWCPQNLQKNVIMLDVINKATSISCYFILSMYFIDNIRTFSANIKFICINFWSRGRVKIVPLPRHRPHCRHSIGGIQPQCPMFYLLVCKLDMICIHDVHLYSVQKLICYLYSSQNREERLGRGTIFTLPLLQKLIQMNFIFAENVRILSIKYIDNMK
jgi:hypothetical protein